MKKEFLVGLISAVAASGALAATAQQVCTGGAAGNGAQVTGAAGTDFVISGFTPKCSTNVDLYGHDQVTFYTVAAGSLKGKNVFIGSSMGGGVKQSSTGTGTNGAVVDGDVSGAGMTAADAISS